MHCDAEQSPLRGTIDVYIQNGPRLQDSICDAPHAPVGFLQHQQVIGIDERHCSWLTQPTDQFRDP